MNPALSFEKLFRRLRHRKVIKHIPKDSIVCDIGCGGDAYFLKSISGLIKHGIGFDRDIENREDAKLELKRIELFEEIPLEKESCDIVTMLAVLEHLANPQEFLDKCFKILKNDGKLILTTPTPPAKPILNFLTFKLGLLDKDGIREHKNYFWPKETKEMLLKSGFKKENIKSYFFECYLNNLIIAQK